MHIITMRRQLLDSDWLRRVQLIIYIYTTTLEPRGRYSQLAI